MCTAKLTAVMMRNAIGFVVNPTCLGDFGPEENFRALMAVSSRDLQDTTSTSDNKGNFIVLYE